ncbi:Kremen protein 1 [Sphaceloma murrayae]|uniref:Kremen protein 1 n=1 Tax=Sphaceloma murrayae TaxID=2082308 RepID=A0A2K1R0P4_9PEZI|nr:Kremen protein 1 [Sphaceloma murrayae]
MYSTTLLPLLLFTTSSLALSPLPKDWSSLGCYPLPVSINPVTEPTLSLPTSMTQTLCLNFCTKKGYPLAALTNKGKCNCTKDLFKNSRQLKATRCGAKCPGNDQETCGGRRAVSLFVRAGTPRTGQTTTASEAAAATTTSMASEGSAASTVQVASRLAWS